MKMKEPTGKHKIPAAGENWMKREMRKPFRVMFWILVVCVGFALVMQLIMFLVESKHEVTTTSEKILATNSRTQRKRRVKKPKETPQQEAARICNDVYRKFEQRGEKYNVEAVDECLLQVSIALKKRGLSTQQVRELTVTYVDKFFLFVGLDHMQRWHDVNVLRQWKREYQIWRPAE